MAAQKADIRLIVGLGNPGANYHSTRHNAGFWLVDEIARDHSIALRNETRFHGEVGKINSSGKDIYLLKPTTFMNKSGQSVAALSKYFKISPEQILVMHDELDLEPGDNRLKKSGGHGGHNGLRDIINHLGKEFIRLRIGIGHPGDRNQVVNYVLKAPSKIDLERIEDASWQAIKIMPTLLSGEFEKAMQQLHTK
ncbi:MAG: aminoacyl-tRNA hydrolase [Gammaproteobacteria bacterium]|jgi:PTH1 family peptidyl-tRNA hydrolase|nr:aminoacyl-tRNA hydrolase [Gammaproteobacteria bacterium]MBT3723713.1 aminoacyl-tRNA hydrolase [Gammaproteobacteria bacterium]MBT4078052.1 aminoacyl-tRNA hydrolase [Gammaproteobacteria bacterium]MBT4195079.1 aminoacyl-tRNA hydrolase [Gammaproteobacteria bacterium]MBT4450967.1 aminoacyl-tRNA hydrolase [Gammaproteobacteria bacterium]